MGSTMPVRRRSVWRFGLLVEASWGVANLSELWLWNRDFWSDQIPAAANLWFWPGLVAMLAAESALLLLLCLLPAQLPGAGRTARWLRRGATMLGVAALAFALFVTLVSWTMCATDLGFLTDSTVEATLSDLGSIWPFLSH